MGPSRLGIHRKPSVSLFSLARFSRDLEERGRTGVRHQSRPARKTSDDADAQYNFPNPVVIQEHCGVLNGIKCVCVCVCVCVCIY